MKRQIIRSLCLLLALLATVAIPDAYARYILTLTNQFVGEINFTGVDRTNTFVVPDLEPGEDASSGHLFGAINEDGTVDKPTPETLGKFGIKEATVTYPVRNPHDQNANIAFYVCYAASSRLSATMNFTATMNITRASGETEQLTLQGVFVTSTPQAGQIYVEKGNVTQYQGTALGFIPTNYVLYTGTIDPADENMQGDDYMKPSGTTATDFVLGPYDSAECTLKLDFTGISWDQLGLNDLACYATIELRANLIE
jgi:hypothetical protein